MMIWDLTVCLTTLLTSCCPRDVSAIEMTLAPSREVSGGAIGVRNSLSSAESTNSF